ncbi:MAG: acetamidase/formamidase family protein [Caulobacter sp.]|nr:acetamidase/formamidase family protein [Caulobacter sp.]
MAGTFMGTRWRGLWLGLIFAVVAAVSPVATASEPVLWTGQWNATAIFEGGSGSGAMALSESGDAIAGTAAPLDENQFFPLTIKGRRTGRARASLDLFFSGEKVGAVDARLQDGEIRGEGALYGIPVTLIAKRPASAGPGRVLDYSPARYALQYSSEGPPALVLRPGDTVRTTTVDNEGRDQDKVWRAMPGNPLTGPFLIEGAMPGDTLVVHLERVALSRDSARMYSGRLNERAVGPGHDQTPVEGWGRGWSLDREKGVARLTAPGDRLADFAPGLKPMIGSIGVAPPLNQTIYAGDLGLFGGNLDYSRLGEGATLYFPVFRAGAFLFLGDGHALQGDGEISGQGLETSLEVQFRVELIKGSSLGQLWFEDADFVMVSGVDNSLDLALQAATRGMARWLKQTYGLNDSEVAAVMSTSIRYDVAEIVDPRPHVVARLSKADLAMIRKPSE